MDTPGKRLRYIRTEKLNITQEALGRGLGLKYAKIKDIENDRLKLTPEIALKIEKVYSIVSACWLMFGDESLPINDEACDNKKIVVSVLSDNMQKVQKSSSDINILNRFELGKKIEFDSEIFTKKLYSRVYMMKVEDLSMDPTIKKDDLVIFEESKSFGADGLYILYINNRLVIRLLQDNFKGEVDIIPINQLYKTYSYNFSNEVDMNILIVGRVLRVIS